MKVIVGEYDIHHTTYDEKMFTSRHIHQGCSGSETFRILARPGSLIFLIFRIRVPIFRARILDNPEIHVHPDFDLTNLINDLCLIEISSEIQFNRHVSEACLPDSTPVEPGTECYIAGWGNVDFDVPRYPPILKEAGSYFDH